MLDSHRVLHPDIVKPVTKKVDMSALGEGKFTKIHTDLVFTGGTGHGECLTAVKHGTANTLELYLETLKP